MRKILSRVVVGKTSIGAHAEILREKIAQKNSAGYLGLETAIIYFFPKEIADLMKQCYLSASSSPFFKLKLKDPSEQVLRVKERLPELLIAEEVWQNHPKERELFLGHLQPDTQIALDYTKLYLDEFKRSSSVIQSNEAMNTWLSQSIYKKTIRSKGIGSASIQLTTVPEEESEDKAMLSLTSCSKPFI